MFEEQVGGPNAATTLSLVAEAHHAVLLNECRLIELAAHWADLHHPASQAPVEKPLPGAEQDASWVETVLQRCWSSPPQSLVRGRKSALVPPAP